MTLDARRRGWGLGFAIALVVAQGANAIPISGELNTTGSVRFSASAIDFLPLAGGTGVFAIDPFTQTGFFVPLAGTTGAVGDLDAATHPVGVAFSDPLWLTFAAQPTVSFTLQLLSAGVFSAAQCGLPAAAGQTCTPSGSAFNLSNLTASSSVLSFAVKGVAVGTAGEETAFTGVFTAQFASSSYQAVLATLQGGGTVQSTYSATFSVPEPGLALLLAGAALLAARVRGR
jgi:hypothetical protein